MKKLLATLSAASVMSIAGVAAAATTVGPPEVDQANASIQLAPVAFTAATCAGEDGMTYETFRGAWKGGENDLTPGSTDYNLSGNVTVKNVVWTINLKTQRGILYGAATLVSPDATGATSTTYTGPLTLVTQGLPNTAGNGVQARGWINAKTLTNSAADGGSLLANVEMQITPGFGANGEFGNQSMGFNDISVTYNNHTC